MKNILYVLHSGITGGTFLTNKDLMKNVEKKFNVFLLGAEKDYLNLFKYENDTLKLIKNYSRDIHSNVSYENLNNVDLTWSAKQVHNSWLTFIYFDVLTKYHIDIVHIRHLINHSLDLPQVAQKLEIPVVLSFHDFYFICPFYVLLDENNKYCAGNCPFNKKNCYCPMDSLNDINSKEFIGEWRINVLNMFQYVDHFVTTSNFVKKLFLSIYTDRDIINDINFSVIEHGRDFPKLKENYFEIPSFEKPIKILCPANHLNIMKGSHIIKNIKMEDKNDKIEFHFLGNCHDGLEECGINHGTYERDDFYKEVKKIKPSFIGIFSIWPETFCHTITEAWSCGIPVLGSNIGVIQERILNSGGGWIIDIDNPKKSFNKILDIVSYSDNENSYLSVQSKINNISFKSTNNMAKEYIEVYNSLINNEEK